MASRPPRSNCRKPSSQRRLRRCGRRKIAQAQQLVDDGPDKPMLDLLFLDAKNGLVVGAYGLAFVTHDGGLSWQSIRSRIDNPNGLHLYSIERVGADLFVAGEQGTLLRQVTRGRPSSRWRHLMRARPSGSRRQTVVRFWRSGFAEKPSSPKIAAIPGSASIPCSPSR